MLNFHAIRNREISLDDFLAGLNLDDLRQETNEMIDHVLDQIAECTDADVMFVPVDDAANDPYASDDTEVNIAWTLGHVIVHITASAEESAALAAEMARGVQRDGRSRSEIPWETVVTIEQCRQRLEESRRMRLASIEMWPNTPNLDYRKETWPGGPIVNAVGRFVIGLLHDNDHLTQINEIAIQAKAARR